MSPAAPLYATCLRCERPLDRNAELPHLTVGRRVAFDTRTGRLWVVCTRCGQWNLAPLEERWEALAECEALATRAEAHVSGGALGLARTRAGLELLRVGGMPAEDIANWRYGRRVRARQRRAAVALVVLAALTLWLAVGAGVVAGSPVVAVFVAAMIGRLFFDVWRHPPRLGARLPDGAGWRLWLWPWQLRDARLVPARDGGGPWLCVPHVGGVTWLRGERAAATLAALLPKLNAADCTAARVADADAVQQVAAAERGVELQVSHARERRRAEQARSHGVQRRAPRSVAPVESPSVTDAAREWAALRGLALPERTPPAVAASALPLTPRQPWERVIRWPAWQDGTPVYELAPEDRLALEMAVTEEVERAAMRARAAATEPTWRAEETVAEIADDLLVPAPVSARLAALRADRNGNGPDAASAAGPDTAPGAGHTAPAAAPAPDAADVRGGYC